MIPSQRARLTSDTPGFAAVTSFGSGEITAGAGSQTINLGNMPSGRYLVMIVSTDQNVLFPAEPLFSSGDWTETFRGDGAASRPGLVVIEGFMPYGANSIDIVKHATSDMNYCFATVANLDRDTPIDAAITSAGNNSGNPNPPSITTVTNNALVIAAFSCMELGTPTHPAYNMIDFESNNGHSCGFAYGHKFVAGAEDPAAFAGVTNDWRAVSIALRPRWPDEPTFEI